MVRSAAAVLAVLILPGFALSQERQTTHRVVDDDTLWDLAESYYDNPFEWRRIWEANRSSIADPNLIYPDQLFVIPGRTAEDTQVAQADTAARPTTGGEPSPGGQPSTGGPAPTGPGGALMPGEIRTIFYQDRTPPQSVAGMMERSYVAVDADEVYSAPWLVAPELLPEHQGTLVGFALEDERGSTLRQFHQVQVRTDAPMRVGDRLRTYRVTRRIPRVGQVVVPTGLLSVTAVHDSGAVAVVSKEYARIQPGDLVGPVPAYDIAAGQYAQDIADGEAAMIMGFAGTAELTDLGHHAFLDLGSEDGVGIGDEFVLYSDAVRSDVRGRLQIVSVEPTTSTAVVVSLVDDVFDRGVIVRRVRQMP